MNPCKKCGGEERYENSGACKRCARERSSKWNAANPDKVKDKNVRYYVSNKERLIAAANLRRSKYHDLVIAAKNKRYAENKERILAANAIWRSENPNAVHIIKSRYRAKRYEAIVPLTSDEHATIAVLYAKAREMTKSTGEAYHVDHIKPLSKGGLHHPNNLQVLLGSENCRKGARV